MSAAASSPMVLMPSFVSRSAAFGPMPLIFLAGSGQIRVSMFSLRIVMPSGFSRSEQILTAACWGDADRTGQTRGAEHRLLYPFRQRAGGFVEIGKIDVDLVDAAVLNLGAMVATAALKRRE